MSPLFASRPPVCRPLSVADADAAAAIHAEGFARGWPAGDLESLILDASVVADGCFSAGWLGGLVGFALSRAAGGEAEILSICVRRSEQGRGVGAALLGRHLARVGQRGARQLFLEVEEGNAAAIALYRRFGFQDVGRRKSYYHKPGGGVLDALVMRRPLG
ncbi:MAG: GNAT family N-acetyltransferase [Rhizobiales bacterium]|nr:GNAT family N-acetyltransferase [Hyphomicrobiales bacterium]